MMTAIIFIIVIGVLIFVHELGHFLVARWCGIRVDAFAIGFGPRLLHWTKDHIEYSLRLIPFGGYVKIYGENPDEVNTTGKDAHRSFANKNRLIQSAVLVAGVMFNFIFAWIIYSITFTTGVTASSDSFDRYADRISDKRIMITSVSADSPAEKVGIKAGDVIKSVELASKKNISSTATTTNLTLDIIQGNINASAGNPITLEYSRNGKIEKSDIEPIQGLVEGKYAIGISMSEVGDMRLPFYISIWEGLRYTVILIKEIIVGLVTFISTIFVGTAKFSDVTGPIGIAGIVGDAANMGFVYLLMITAYISLNLGVINLIPFPALDGGRLLFVIIESIIRKRIPMKFSMIVNTVGFALLMLLMIVITYKDIARIFK